VLAIFTVAESRVSAQQVIDREYVLKARFLAIVGEFVREWPANVKPSAANPMTIGVLGADPFAADGGNHLDRRVRERNRTYGKNIQVRRFASVKDYQPCHVLFVSQFATQESAERTADVRLEAIVKKTQGQPVLLIGDAPEMAKQGIVINLILDGNRIKLEINPQAAARRNLALDPSILRPATIIRD
jgi:hypothetical protein